MTTVELIHKAQEIIKDTTVDTKTRTVIHAAAKDVINATADTRASKVNLLSFLIERITPTVTEDINMVLNPPVANKQISDKTILKYTIPMFILALIIVYFVALSNSLGALEAELQPSVATAKVDTYDHTAVQAQKQPAVRVNKIVPLHPDLQNEVLRTMHTDNHRNLLKALYN